MLKSYFIFTFLLLLAQTAFIKDRLKVIDEKNNNFFLRGNLPIEKNKFQYEQLREGVDEITNTTGHNLVVISLLNFLTPKETKNRYIEEKYFDNHFEVNGALIKYQNYVVLGSLIDPSSVPLFLRNILVSYYDWVSFDKLNSLLKQVKNYLKSSNPTIVYVHCSAGVDRTGYVGGAYKMKYQKKSLSQVLDENLNILKGLRKNMHFNTYNGLQWYCLSLGRTEKECLIGEEKNFRKNNTKQEM